MTRLSTSLMSGLLALTAAALLPSCESTQNKAGYDDVVDYTTPKTNLSKEEYPFDEEGNYLENYAARGSGTADNKPPRDAPEDTAMYTQPADDTPARPTTYTTSSYTPERTSTSARKPTSSSSSGRTASTSSKPKPKPKPTASKSKPKPKPTASKPKPKPKPAAPKPTYVKVKPGDTLYGLSNRYGVSVAAIKSANGLSSDTIRDGKSLKIPPKKK